MNDAAPKVAACIRNAQGLLVITDDSGTEYLDVRPQRMFPITDPDGFISISDAQGKELFCIAGIEELPPESREIILHEMKRCMFTPSILQITGSIPFGEYVRFFVETDRGETDMTVDTGDIYRLSENRILMKDVNGIRYLIPDWRKMSSHSRRILDEYL